MNDPDTFNGEGAADGIIGVVGHGHMKHWFVNDVIFDVTDVELDDRAGRLILVP